MSGIYDLLDDYLKEYESHKSETEFNSLSQAIDRLDLAMQQQTLKTRLQGLRDASAMAKGLADRPVSLVFDFYLASELIGTANDMVEGLEVVRPAAMESRSVDYELKSQRVGLNNLLASAYALVDPLGFESEIQEVGLIVEASPLTDNEDLCVGLGAQYEVQIASGNYPAAKQLRDEIWAHARMLENPLYYLHAAAFDCGLAFAVEDWQGMVDAATDCMQMISPSNGTVVTGDGESVDLKNDADFRVVSAAHACGLAKQGFGRQITPLEMSHSGPDLPAPFHFYWYWIDCHLALGKPARATCLAVEAWEEINGKGQNYREVQALCQLIRCLQAASRQEEVADWAKLARAAAERLRDPEPMLEQVQALL
ncbi:MAG: hypothetical protein ACR2OA_16565 [Rubripirellula sp.]|jgi:hypothetical protein